MSDQTQSHMATGFSILGILLLLVVAAGLYIFCCYCMKLICKKTGHEPGVLIWIPVVQMVPLLEVAGLPVWTIILFFVPVANAVFGIVMWVKICQARGKSGWLVVLMFIPILNLAFLPYLAFSD